ncbi:MAG: gliding motility-associated C-terminal domain-containing protein [Bacteroidetes bacterium]|nr:gliding motility-associated C-terminal domain-containing protein [Bacteroidota bacterium]
MTVNPLMPVSVTISASANPVCAGTSVTFTATSTNEGSSPSYQWLVNGINAGTNSPSFAYTPANNDQVICILTSNITCASGNPATSNTITMTVNSLMPVSVTISASANPVCDGTTVTFTATSVNEGSNPSYQWQVNGINAGTNSPSFAYTPVNNDMVNCILTSSITCPTSNPATSNKITLIVNPFPVPEISGTDKLCEGAAGVLYTTQQGMTGYEWSISSGGIITQGTGNDSIYVNWNSPGSQYLTVIYTSPEGCKALKPDSMTLTVNRSPDTYAGQDGTICPGESYTVKLATASDFTSLIWTTTGSGSLTGEHTLTPTYYPSDNESGTITLTLTATGNPPCGNDIASMRLSLPINPLANAGQDHNVKENTQDTLSGQGLGGSGQFSYHWEPVSLLIAPDQQTVITLPMDKDTIFILRVTDLLTGCSSSDSVRIHIDHPVTPPDEDCIVVHNVITPDGDGANDTWIIDCIADYPDNTVEIFNRWGNPVNRFERYDNIENVWKGTNFKGESMPDGTYYYVLKIKNRISRSGWIYLRGGRN